MQPPTLARPLIAALVGAALVAAAGATRAPLASAWAANAAAAPEAVPASLASREVALHDLPRLSPAGRNVSAPGLDPAVLDLALAALECARKSGLADGRHADKVLSIIDYSLPSTEPRLWVLDLEHGSTLFVERVAHGRNTGENLATHFSNVPESNESSVGRFRTGETYAGKHGLSLRLDGLEAGFNDKARARGIVVHGADYCTSEHVDTYGRLGRSQGCPALAPEVSSAVIDTIRDGTLLFAYFPESEWLAGSAFMHCDAG